MASKTDIYLGEYGAAKRIIIGVDYDVSSATLSRIVFSAPAGTFSATCSILGANYTTSGGTVFSASKAFEYIPASGDFSAVGADSFRAWLNITFTGSRLISDSFTFVVSNPGD